jgi:hypothetical protein
VKAQNTGVAAGVSPAVEPGILPGGLGLQCYSPRRWRHHFSGRRDAALYVRRDA